MSETSARTPLSELLASMQAEAGVYRARIPDDWQQGRAIYGGLSTALCLQAIYSAFDDLPPLRSVQVAFVGPAGGEVAVRPTIVRRGKSTAFIAADLSSGEQTAVRATFCFGAARESKLSAVDLPAPKVSAPADCGRFFEDARGRNMGPNFAQHFNSRRAGAAMPVSAAEQPEFLVWMQHKDAAVDPVIVGLAALADALPPAALACFDTMAPVSSMTWMFDVLAAEPMTEDGWWLCHSRADVIETGYSSQAMTIWNRRGEPVIAGRQNVAVFF